MNTLKKLFKIKYDQPIFIIIGVLKVTLLIAILLFILLSLLNLKQFLGLASSTFFGARDLNASIIAAKSKDFATAKISGEAAQRQFTKSLTEIKSINNSSLAYLPLVQGQLKEVEHLITAIGLASRGFNQGISFAADLADISSGNISSNYSTFTKEQKTALLSKLYASTPELNGLYAVSQLALDELDKLKLHGVLWPAKYQILEAREKIRFGSALLKEAVPLSQLLPALAGHPATSTFLLVLQNSDELRPSGGFIGTYGILQTQSGDIARLDTHDIYHMDMPAQSHIKVDPPTPIKLYLNKDWYMRDANWSPDWPTSARQLEWFYQLENRYLTDANDINRFNGQWTGVIAINPRLVSNLLDLVGPIAIDGQEYTTDNLSQVLEFEVEQGYAEAGTSKWQRKEVIGKIIKELKRRLFNLPSSEWANILTALQNNLTNKDLLLYFSDDELNAIAQNNNWGGELKQTDGDFAMVVDSNFASLKSDKVIGRDFSRKIEKDSNGLKATINITYHHRGTVKDWRTDRYKNYVRLFVPAGSQLVSFSGTAVSPVTTSENGKTVFGSLIYVELNSSKTITISYYLPPLIEQKWNQGKYALYWQRQPGSRIEKTQVDVILPSGVKSMNPQSGVISSDKKMINWSLDLTKDQEISLNF